VRRSTLPPAPPILLPVQPIRLPVLQMTITIKIECKDISNTFDY